MNARPQYTSITRERPTAPAQPEETGETREGGTTSGRRQYVSIDRQRPSRPAQPESETREADAPTTGRREYVTIERQRPAVQSRPTQLESEAREADPSTGDLEYATIERQRPAAQPETERTAGGDTSTGDLQYVTIERQRPAAQPETETTAGGDPSTGDLEYVVIERQRPPTSSRVTPAADTLFPQEPTLEYVTITRSRVSPTATLPLSGTEATVSAAEGLEGRSPSPPRYHPDRDMQGCHVGPWVSACLRRCCFILALFCVLFVGECHVCFSATSVGLLRTTMAWEDQRRTDCQSPHSFPSHSHFPSRLIFALKACLFLKLWSYIALYYLHIFITLLIAHPKTSLSPS